MNGPFDPLRYRTTVEVDVCDYCGTKAKLYRVGEDAICAECRADVQYCERKGKEELKP